MMLRGKSLGLLGSFLLAAVAAPAQTPPAQTPPELTPPAQPPSGNPTRMAGNTDWASGYFEARQRAAAHGKFVYVEFDRRGCGNCRRMDALLYPAFDFEALMVEMVPIKIMIDNDDGKELAESHGVTEAPAVLIESPEGRQVFFMQGFTNAPDFYSHVKSEIAEYKAFARKVEAQDIAQISAREAFDTGKELYSRGDSAAALPRLKRATAAPDAPAGLREDAQELLAAVQLDLRDSAGSRQTIKRLIATTKDSRRRERAELFQAQIPLSENKPREAYALFLKFQKDHPKSPYLEQVRSLIEKMKSQLNPPAKP